ncbi:hypothetical protein [Nitrosospira briensis]|uniref:hypothetical protein n=1 Tax=Nitrosospira briensis TaxID=35799 RepID=UPI000942E158|nr:hypothetical protein [Nitrosospira briensis]
MPSSHLGQAAPWLASRRDKAVQVKAVQSLDNLPRDKVVPCPVKQRRGRPLPSNPVNRELDQQVEATR